MFRGQPVTDKYSCSSTKSAYLLWYSVGEILKVEQLRDNKDVPYTFKFDEATSSHVLKQHDGYLCYFEVVNTYAGSLFMSYCTAPDLMPHFYEVVQPLSSKCESVASQYGLSSS